MATDLRSIEDFVLAAWLRYGAAYLAATGQPAPLWLLEKLTVPKADAVRGRVSSNAVSPDAIRQPCY